MNLDQALRDAAEPVPARVGGKPAQALLDRIVSSSASPAPTPVKPGRAASHSRRTAIALVAAAAAATAALTLPSLGSGAAYASWTPQPSPLAAADRDALTHRCLAQVDDDYQSGHPDRRVVHSEQRGDYAYLSVVTPGWTASCFRDRDDKLRTGSFMTGPASAAKLGRTGVELQGWPQLQTEEGYSAG